MSDLPLDRIVLHEAIRQLVSDGETFPGDLADQVIVSLPLTGQGYWIRITGAFRQRQAPDRLSLASGPQDTGDDKWVEFGKEGGHRIGLYVVEHFPGKIYIRSITSNTNDGGGEACLHYRRRRATSMRLSVVKTIVISRARLALVTWRAWKRRQD
ncbi:hypothetical protein [Xanthomonas albilineans]|uniref:Uncharacterized protein n=1 Tax=Xanthomonas albilineans (strain GPE PC73 / CFBP 7063) TaxID=380358 RepID=D2UAM7_XANAP|nr:hypothetical protein [Xanthomonas albilineans]CBA14784.1 hypothetical protein XALC_0239 [Xanthomonas albilineans GPE PC73]